MIYNIERDRYKNIKINGHYLLKARASTYANRIKFINRIPTFPDVVTYVANDGLERTGVIAPFLDGTEVINHSDLSDLVSAMFQFNATHPRP
jgi:hypothetical protein